MKLRRSFARRALGLLAATTLLIAATARAAVVPIHIDCPGGPGAPQVTPAIVFLNAGDTAEWRTDFTCAGGPCNAFFYEIVIPPCPPLFTLGSSTGMIPMTQPVSSPIAEANSGVCKYTVNFYNGAGALCATLDPYLIGQAQVPGQSPGTLMLLALIMACAAIWVMRRESARAHVNEVRP